MVAPDYPLPLRVTRLLLSLSPPSVRTYLGRSLIAGAYIVIIQLCLDIQVGEMHLVMKGGPIKPLPISSVIVSIFPSHYSLDYFFST